MIASFTEEHNLLRNSLRAFLKDNYSTRIRSEAIQSPLGRQPELWRAMAEDLGILGLTFAERIGGVASDTFSTLVVMEELGRALVVEPYLDTVITCGGLLRRVSGQISNDMLANIAKGNAIVAFAWSEPRSRYDVTRVETRATHDGTGWRLQGEKSVVIAAEWASHLVVVARTAASPGSRHGLSLFLVDKMTPGIEVTNYPTVDGRRAGDITFNAVQLHDSALIGEESAAIDLIEQALDESIAAVCGEALGVMSRMLEDTVEYTKQRRQFGQPLSSFQVLQHRMVDMYIHLEMARSAAYLAASGLQASATDRAIAASTAKVTIANACRFVGQNAVQLHGGMGMTDELPISHFFKRATLIQNEFGTSDFHLSRHAKLIRSKTNN